MIKIKIISNCKGSNPGGVCEFQDEKEKFLAYLKYCPGTTLPKNYPFNPQNQPVYEAITVEMARILGLRLPRTFVLIGGNNIEIEKERGIDNGWDKHRKYYFLSRIINCQKEGPAEEGEKEISKQEIYLELLKISDIVGRKQNWIYCPEEGIFYLDVGCGVVQAHGGKIGMKYVCRKYFETDEREVKKARKDLSKHYILLNDGKTILSIEEILERIYSLRIPTKNPSGIKSLEKLISHEEIEGFIKILTLNIEDKVREYERTRGDLVIRI